MNSDFFASPSIACTAAFVVLFIAACVCSVERFSRRRKTVAFSSARKDNGDGDAVSPPSTSPSPSDVNENDKESLQMTPRQKSRKTTFETSRISTPLAQTSRISTPLAQPSRISTPLAQTSSATHVDVRDTSRLSTPAMNRKEQSEEIDDFVPLRSTPITRSQTRNSAAARPPTPYPSPGKANRTE